MVTGNVGKVVSVVVSLTTDSVADTATITKKLINLSISNGATSSPTKKIMIRVDLCTKYCNQNTSIWSMFSLVSHELQIIKNEL